MGPKQSNQNKQLIPLTMITQSGYHCNIEKNIMSIIL